MPVMHGWSFAPINLDDNNENRPLAYPTTRDLRLVWFLLSTGEIDVDDIGPRNFEEIMSANIIVDYDLEEGEILEVELDHNRTSTSTTLRDIFGTQRAEEHGEFVQDNVHTHRTSLDNNRNMIQ